MSRERVKEILESYGFAVYDSETTEELREALFENVKDGTISKALVNAP
jgi:hypothetical protein